MFDYVNDEEIDEMLNDCNRDEVRALEGPCDYI